MNKNFDIAFDDLRRAFFAERPRDVDGIRNRAALYYRRWMLRKVFAIFELSGVPEAWDLDYFWTHLFIDGGVCITDTDMGVLALHTCIAERQTSEHAVTVSEVKEMVDDAIWNANRKTIGHFFDILLAKRYDDEDMIVLREKDFI